MASQDTSIGYANGLFVQSITTGTETALLVPATAGIFPGLPGPDQPASTGLDIGVPPDVQFGVWDGHPFKVRVAGKINTGASITFLANLYYVPAAIATAQTAATLANDTVVVSNAASAAFSGAGNFVTEAEFLWDSVSKKLVGFVTASQVNGVNIAANSGTAGTNVATSVVTVTYTAGTTPNPLNFIPSFTFGTANAANTVQLTEFTITRA